MLLTQSDKLRSGLDFPISYAEPTLLGYHNKIHDLSEPDLIIFAMESFVHAYAVKSAKALLCFFDCGHGDSVIGSALHYLMVQDESVLVFDHAHTQAKLHWHAGLALADPFSMRLEQGEDLLLVRNVLALQDPAVNLVDLAHGVLHELVELSQDSLSQEGCCQHDFFQPTTGVACPIEMDLRLLEIDAVRLPHCRLFLLTPALVLRGGVLELLRLPVELLELTQVVGTLAPVAQSVGLAQVRRDLDGLAYRIPQEIDVSWVMPVRLDNKGVTTSLEAFFPDLFFYQHVTGINHCLIDSIQ